MALKLYDVIRKEQQIVPPKKGGDIKRGTSKKHNAQKKEQLQQKERDQTEKTLRSSAERLAEKTTERPVDRSPERPKKQHKNSDIAPHKHTQKLADVATKKCRQFEEYDEYNEDSDDEYGDEYDNAAMSGNKKKKPHKTRVAGLLIFAGICSIVVGLYIAGMYFVHAQITITERTVPFSLEKTSFIVANENTAGSDKLAFQVVKVPAQVSVKAYGAELVQGNSKASGIVVLLNEASTTPQKIAAGTVITATDTKKKYVTKTDVSVPGFTGTTKKVAGSISVEVEASVGGPEYNIQNSALFGVAGWKDAKQFYARSVGSISGGEQKMQHTVTPEEKASYSATLQAKLRNKLTQETKALIDEVNAANKDHPEKAVLTYPDLQIVTIDPTGTVFQGDGVSFEASMKGTMVSFLLPRNFLEQKIAGVVTGNKTDTAIAIPALDTLNVSIDTSTTNITGGAVPDQITITVAGQATVVHKVSLERVSQALLGQSRSIFDETMHGIPSLQSARFVLYPFWAPFFPSKIGAMNVVVDQKNSL